MSRRLAGRVLLDVRSDIETSEGTVRSPTKVAVTIPMFDARTRYNPAAREAVDSSSVSKPLWRSGFFF